MSATARCEDAIKAVEGLIEAAHAAGMSPAKTALLQAQVRYMRGFLKAPAGLRADIMLLWPQVEYLCN